MATTPLAPAAALFGIGWRQPHYERLLEDRPALDFIEVHSENFFADGGISLAVLDAGREAYAVSLHGVGLALRNLFDYDLVKSQARVGAGIELAATYRLAF